MGTRLCLDPLATTLEAGTRSTFPMPHQRHTQGECLNDTRVVFFILSVVGQTQDECLDDTGVISGNSLSLASHHSQRRYDRPCLSH